MNQLRTSLGLKRNIVVMLASIIILGLGEELWTRFIPKYLELLGATTWVVASYGTLRGFLDAVYQYPGGWLTSAQMLAAILVYIPIAKLSDSLNRKPFILVTFAFFAFFPLTLASATGFVMILIAFLFAGLREIGEPARKALIVDLAKDTARGRAVGLYYLIRGLVVFPASLVGGWLWAINVQLPFYAAFVVGIVGCLSYAILGKDESHIVSLQ